MRTYNGPQERLRALELGGHKLDHELLHVALHFRVLHDLAPERGDHVERAKALLGGAMRDENGVNEAEDGEECRLRPIPGE